MKILIADDQTQRYKSLIGKLISQGIPRESIKLVSSAFEAKEHLENIYFDLFILDILLPLWSEDMGDNGNFSREILLSLHKTDEYRKPGEIIGITGDKNTVTAEILEFENYLLAVLEYSSSCSQWESQILNKVNYISNQVQDSSSTASKSKVDLAIVCALQDPELSEVLKLPWNWSEAIPLNDKLFYRKGEFSSNGRVYSVVAACCERMGMVSSTLTSTSLINAFSPKVIAMTGICAGVRDHVKLGDIIFAEFVWDYQNGKRMDKGEHQVDPFQVPASPCIKAHAKELKNDIKFFKELVVDYDDELESTSVPKLHVGPVAVGSSVIADQEIVDQIKGQSRKVLGIEMEILGLYYAAQNASSPTPKCFAIKSVCDFADSQKNDDFQRYASYSSAKTLQKLLETYAGNLIN